MNSVATRLSRLGLSLPQAAAPAANYVPWVLSGRTLYISGQTPTVDGVAQCVGVLGRDVSVAQGQQAARLCALNILAQAAAALEGDLDRIARCLRLGGFVRATEDFEQQPQVINGASDLIVQVLGDAGRHARTSVGVASLPRGVAVEIDAVFEVR